MKKEIMIPYREYLEMFEFTPEGYLRFDVLLDEFLRLNFSPRANEEDRRIFWEKMEKLLSLADPEDFSILKASDAWRNMEESEE